MPAKVVYIKGQQFGRWTVLGQARRPGHLKNKTVHWRCRCECGTVKVVSGASLRCGTSKSCGCASEGHKFRTAAGESGFKFLFKKYKNHARYRGFAFRLSRRQFKALTSSSCSYCGAPPSAKCIPTNLKFEENRRNATYVYNGVDRIDSGQGYTNRNCVPACTTCNRAKSDLSIVDFYRWVHRAAAHLKGRGL